MGKADQDETDKRVCVARIGAAHGVRGDVRLWSFTAEPGAIGDFGPLQTGDGRTFEIEALRPAGECFVAHFKGVADRNAAEKLRNLELYVERARLPAVDDADEFYHADLIGLEAVDAAGASLGTIIAVHNFGAGDLLELRLVGQRDTVMLPFNAAVVPAVDIAGGRITVEMPAGLREDEGGRTQAAGGPSDAPPVPDHEGEPRSRSARPSPDHPRGRRPRLPRKA